MADGLPESFDPQWLVGKQAGLLAFAEYQINLHLEEWTVTLAGRFAHRTPSGLMQATAEGPLPSSTLTSLVGRTLQSAQLSSDRKTLALVFDDGQELHCIDDTPIYHGFWIASGGRCFYA
jgi:hypothetical protein